MRDSGALVYPNLSFADSEGKPHEIDALAFLSEDELEEDWLYGPISVNLLLECKTTEHRPWVFFEEPYDPVTSVSGLAQCLTCTTDIAIAKPNLLLAGCGNTALRGHHYNNWNVPTARTYFEAFGKDAGKDIFQGVTSIWYAQDFFGRFFAQSNVARQEAPKRQRTSLVHGVIVHKGTLVVASVLEGEKYLREEPHVLLRTTDCLTNSRLPFGSARETVIDVVQEDYFEEYLQLCQKDPHLFARHLKSLVEAEWLSGKTKINSLADSPYNPNLAVD